MEHHQVVLLDRSSRQRTQKLSAQGGASIQIFLGGLFLSPASESAANTSVLPTPPSPQRTQPPAREDSRVQLGDTRILSSPKVESPTNSPLSKEHRNSHQGIQLFVPCRPHFSNPPLHQSTLDCSCPEHVLSINNKPIQSHQDC